MVLRCARGPGRPVPRCLAPAALAVLALLAARGVPQAQEAGRLPYGTGLSFIEALYQEGERYRAQSETLRWLHAHPEDPRRGAVELLQAKLYYREARYSEATLRLYSVLDRHPRGETGARAGRLLGYALVRQGQLDEAAGALPPGAGREDLGALAGPPPDAVPPGRAVAWSTWLPGSGFFLLGEPGKATAALTLNLAFTAGAVIAWQQDNRGAALALALVEVALYTGGRRAVRDAARARLARQQAGRRADWLAAHGEPELLRVGLRVDF